MKETEHLHAHHRERMIEKFLSAPEGFSNHELLEILLFPVVPRKDTNALAHRILSVFPDLTSVFEADVETLRRIDGVGERVAAEIKAFGLLFSRVAAEKREPTVTAFSLAAVLPRLYDAFTENADEAFACYFFDDKSRLLTKTFCTSKKAGEVSVDLNTLLDVVTVQKPRYALMCHNHPSGALSPSKEDDRVTVKLNIFFSLHNVTLIDHVIIGKERTSYSYFKEGRLQHVRDMANVDKLIDGTISTL